MPALPAPLVAITGLAVFTVTAGVAERERDLQVRTRSTGEFTGGTADGAPEFVGPRLVDVPPRPRVLDGAASTPPIG